jgi:glycosyltransferase involved in cell wall biosynthesis
MQADRRIHRIAGEAGNCHKSVKKRLLLIAYFFPPHNLTESRRALVITRAAVNDGWHVDVIAPWAPNFHSGGEFCDWRRYFSAPNRIEVHRTPGGLSDRSALISKWSHRLLSHVWGEWRLHWLMRFPDSCVSWLFFLVPRAVWLSLRNRPDVVLTSSFPYSAHIAGLIVTKLFRRPWIVDMREPWAVDDSEAFVRKEPSPRLRRWHRSLMSIVMKRASQIWSMTPDIRNATAKFCHDQDSTKFVAMVHGYDLNSTHEFEQTDKPDREARDGSEFVLGYAGSFRPNITPAEPIMMALNILKNGNPDIYSMLRLRVWGYTSRKGYYNYLLKAMSDNQVEDRLDHRDSLPEHKLISLLKGCDALLLTNGSSEWTQKRLTTKVYPYLSAQRPILAICEPGSAVGKLISEANVGLVASPVDPKAVALVLANWVRVRDTEGLYFQPNVEILERYSLQKGVMPLMAKKLREAGKPKKRCLCDL